MNEIELIRDFVENHKCNIDAMIKQMEDENASTTMKYKYFMSDDKWIRNLKERINNDPETIKSIEKQLQDHYQAVAEEKAEKFAKKEEKAITRKKEEAERKLKNAAYEKKQNYQRMIEDDYNKEQHRLSEIERKSKLWDKANKLHKQHPGLPVTQIAREVGYSNVESLYQMLRRHKGWL